METCKECGKAANRHLTSEDGTSRWLCHDCYNTWYCKRVGLTSSLFDHPDQITVLGHIFFLKHQFLVNCVYYAAIEDPKRGFYRFSYTAPFEMDGFTATEQLRKVIARGIRKPTLDGNDTLAEKGTLDIVEIAHDPDQVAIVIDGTVYKPDKFFEILKNSKGYKMVYKLEEAMYCLDDIWYTMAEHMPTGVL